MYAITCNILSYFVVIIYVIVMYDGLEIVYREIMHVKKIIYLNLVIIENFILKFFVYH